MLVARTEVEMDSHVQKFLIVSIDCLRYDALSRTNTSLNTPKFDDLTRDYTLAERFFVTAPATRPSHTSLFTGLYPFEHGLYGQTYLKMFEGIPNLLQLFSDAGYQVTGRSERPEVFRFLDFEQFITVMDPKVQSQHLGSLENLFDTIFSGEHDRQFCFLHFWYTHGGYGMQGIRNAPKLKELVDTGRVEEALRYYFAAVTHVQEFLLVELLKRVDLSEWAVFIVGDHGEGFCEESIAHGDLLHPNTLHVPLLCSIPGVESVPIPEGPASMIDLYPTIVNLAGIDVDYCGFGVNLISESSGRSDRWVLSELDSLYGVGFLNAGNLQTPHDRVTSRVSFDHAELSRFAEGTRQWAISDGDRLYRQSEGKNDGCLRDMGGVDLAGGDVEDLREIYKRILDGSGYKDLIAQESTTEEVEILEERLRGLGYIE